MNLTHDTRCVGRLNLRPDSTVCPVRETCARFTALQAGGIQVVAVVMLACSTPDFERRIAVEKVSA